MTKTTQVMFAVLLMGTIVAPMRAADAEATATDALASAILADVKAAYAGSDRSGVISLHEETGVRGPAIRLRDIAKLSGAGAEALGDLEVARFSENERSIRVGLGQLREVLGEVKVNWGRMSLRGYANCKVHRTGKPIAKPKVSTKAAPAISNPKPEIKLDTAVTVEQKLNELIAKMVTFDRSELRITYRERDEKWLSQPVIGQRFEFEPIESTLPGRLPVTIRKYEGEQVVDTFRLTVDVARAVEAVVAVRTVRHNDTFGPNNIEKRQVMITSSSREPATSLKDIYGLRSTAYLKVGDGVYREDARAPIAVKRGQLIRITAPAGALMVRTIGRSLGQGSVGDLIQVRNERSRETFYARITGEGAATVAIDKPTEKESRNDDKPARDK